MQIDLRTVAIEPQRQAFDHLVRRFGDFTAVASTSFDVHRGEIFGLLGPNGAGKTTTFYMIVGLEQPTSGEVFVSDVKVTGMPMFQRAQLGISYLAQEASIFRKLTVEENLMAILETTKMTVAECRAKVDSLLEEFHIRHVASRKGTELSGGERRRVEIARCLAIEPQFILLDEPFGALDALTRVHLQRELQRIWVQQRSTMIMVTHDVEEALYLGDRVIVMDARPGRVKHEVHVDLPHPRERQCARLQALKDELLTELVGNDREAPAHP